MRLVDANALRNRLGEMWGIPKDWDGDIDQLCEDVFLAIDEAPTIEAESVRHGYWIKKFVESIEWNFDEIFYECSECALLSKSVSEFCPHCGAKMDGDKEHG